MGLELGNMRFESPGQITGTTDTGFQTLIDHITAQGNEAPILEIFKKHFSHAAGVPYRKSSNQEWARNDLNDLMNESRNNAALYIEAIHNSLDELDTRNFLEDVPDRKIINQVLKRTNADWSYNDGTFYRNQNVEPNTDSHEIEIENDVSLDEEHAQKLQLAGDLNTAEEFLRGLSQSEFEDIREAIAGNTSTPADVLSRLGRQGSSVITRVIAANMATPSEVLHELATSDDANTRLAVAGNPNTWAQDVDSLRHDTDPAVKAKAALRRVERPLSKKTAADPSTSAVRASPTASASTAKREKSSLLSVPKGISCSDFQKVIIRAVDREIVFNNLYYDGHKLVDKTDELLIALDQFLDRKPGIGHNQAPENFDLNDLNELALIRMRLSAFRNSLADAVSASQNSTRAEKIDSVITSGASMISALKEIDDISIARSPILAVAGIGVSVLAGSVGFPLTPDLVAGVICTMVAGSSAEKWHSKSSSEDKKS